MAPLHPPRQACATAGAGRGGSRSQWGGGSAADDGGAEQAQRRGAERKHGGVEALQGESLTPLLLGLLTQVEDRQLAPGVAAVGRVEGSPPGLGERGRAGQV